MDGYIEDESVRFDWAQPDEGVHTFVNNLLRRSVHICTAAEWTRQRLVSAGRWNGALLKPD